MKRVYIIIFAGLMMLGCDDFLEVTPETSFVPATFFDTENEIERGIAGIYRLNRSMNASRQWRFGENRSDNSSFQFNPQDRGGQLQEALDEFLMTADNPNISNYWNDLYNGVGRANYVLENIDAVRFSSNTVKEQRRGEALFLRSWFYFNLVRNWGGVPYVTSTFETLDESLGDEFTQRVNIDVVYDSILNDAQQAIDALPVSWDEDNVGRATRGAALMLKAKMHMARREYPEAIPLLEEMTTLGYELLDSYESVFNPDNKNHAESVFELQYSFALGQSSNFLSNFVPFNSGGDLLDFGAQASSRAGQNQPTTDLIETYEEGDIRRDVTIAYYSLTETDSIPFLNKYNYPFLDVNAQDVNWQMFRYADALLMLAECLNEVNGFDQNAIGIVNVIRLRAGLPPLSDAGANPELVIATAEDLSAAIAKERRLELAFENHRWFDLVRRGEAVDVMTAHGLREISEKTTVLSGAYTNIRTDLGIPSNQVLQFGLDQNIGW
ncbi:MAG: RagB/SusD family nutrient uptake outer membrane protein [Bacteroidota bacterium]